MRRTLAVLDQYQRPLRDLRISVTDRCNFRCTYCMPLDEYEWIHKSQVLTFEEITRLAGIFADLGVGKIRLTGGEPLLRKDLPRLVEALAGIDPITDVCMTTNASRLVEMAKPLADAGLGRVTVSLDSLRPERFRAITQRAELQPVLAGLEAAKAAGLGPIKLNAVIERGVNDDEMIDLLEFARGHELELRYIEFMDVGNANQWHSSKLVSKAEILRTIAAVHDIAPVAEPRGSAPSTDYQVSGGGRFGVIASVTEPFCGDCSRARLTAGGKFVTCLFAGDGRDLKTPIRDGAADAELRSMIESVWLGRTDRYSEQRLVELRSARGYQPQRQQKIEMISLGG